MTWRRAAVLISDGWSEAHCPEQPGRVRVIVGGGDEMKLDQTGSRRVGRRVVVQPRPREAGGACVVQALVSELEEPLWVGNGHAPVRPDHRPFMPR